MTELTEEQKNYIQYRDALQFSLSTLLGPHNQIALVEIAINIVLDAAQTQKDNGETGILDVLERACSEIRAGNAEAAE